MKNITIIVVAFMALGIVYLFLKNRKDRVLLASAISGGETAIPLPLLPGTDRPVGLKPRPGIGITLPLPLPMPAPSRDTTMEQLRKRITAIGAHRIMPSIFSKFGI